VAPPVPVVLFLCWLVFRLEFGAGMIKIRGGREWRDLTAMEFHHETQPMPGPFSWHAHRLPRWAHRVEVVGNHVVQLGVQWFLFAPQPVASVAAGLVILSQLWLIVTGNFAWLNWITVVLAFAAVDDRSLRAVLPWLRSRDGAATPEPGSSPLWWVLLVTAVTAGLVLLSIRPLVNLFSRRQLMNASFNRYHLVNAYGAFGTVTKVRRELIVEGTDAADPDEETGWREYGFRGKPGDPLRRPPQFAPYHLRLDWLLWFLALGVRDTAWFERYLERLLEGDRAALALLRDDPFPDGPPRWIRVTVWRYRFTTRRERRETGAWWVRTRLGVLVEPMTLGE
jgi:predicted small integral membrane protein